MDPKHWLSLLWFVKHLGSLRQAHQQLLSTLHCHQTGLASWFTQGVGASLSCALRAPNTQQQWQRVYSTPPTHPKLFFSQVICPNHDKSLHIDTQANQNPTTVPPPPSSSAAVQTVSFHTQFHRFSFQHCLSHSRGQGKRPWVSILGVFAYTVSTRFRLMTWSV